MSDVVGGGNKRKLEPEGEQEQSLVGIPPDSRLRMMNFAENPTTDANFGDCFENLGAKSGTREETTAGQEGDDVLIGFQ